jgi:diadenosine tetraphosphate (Ap4A) HIT family hydrolase
MSERDLTIFDKIAQGDMPARIVWEDESYMAFLTPFPNTPGFTVLIPKTFCGDYAFALDDEQYAGLMKATKTVANILEKAFDTPRVALIIEGTGVAYVHVKLIPLHGNLAGQTDVWSTEKEFHEDYRGWITSAEGPEMDAARLDEIQAKIKAVQ